MAKYVPPADSSHGYTNPISATRLLNETIARAQDGAGNVDVPVLRDCAKSYMEQVIGPRQSGESPDAYQVRAFTGLLEQCTRHHGDGTTAASERRDAVVTYAKEAMEAGDLETAGRWCSELGASTGPGDPTCWTLYGTFCARQRRWYDALECARKAIALDGRDRIALFFRVALLMATGSERFDEIDGLLERLESAYPWFGDGHFLSAVHSARMEMPDRTGRFLSLANTYVDVQRVVGWAENAVLDGAPMTVWDTDVDYGGDPALKCATLLIRLGLSGLAASCMRVFARRSDNPAAFHYLMAVAHHKTDEFQACADHLNAMPADDGGGETDRRRSLLAAHNDFGAGRDLEAVAGFAKLSSGRARTLYGLAYARLADLLVSSGEYAEAADVLCRACAVAAGRGTPVLLTKLGACLVALKKYPEAERVLAAAVSFDGARNGDAWNYLAVVNARSNRTDMADECYRRAAELMEFKSVLGAQYDLLSYKYH